MKKPIFNFLQYLTGAKIWDYLPIFKVRQGLYKKVFAEVGKNVSYGYHLDFCCPHGSAMQTIKLGNNVSIARECVIELCADLVIEDDVWISERTEIFRHTHGLEKGKKKSECEIQWSQKLIIGEDAWIGSDVIILSKVTYIGKGAVVAAGAVVTKNVDDYTVVAGNPARVIQNRLEN